MVVAALLTVTDEPDTAVTVVPAAIPDDVDVTVAPTAIADESEATSTKTDESLTIATSVTTVCEMVYVGAIVGETVGATEGATDGLGVGFPGV